jgi:hypothetical protein
MKHKRKRSNLLIQSGVTKFQFDANGKMALKNILTSIRWTKPSIKITVDYENIGQAHMVFLSERTILYLRFD